MKELFEYFGLGQREEKTFLRLLELGAQPVSVIAKQIGMPRSSMYLVLENLAKVGLVEEFGRAGIKYVKCISVKNIPDLLKVKRADLQFISNLLEEKMLDLEMVENKLSVTPTVRFFEGKEAVKRVYEEVLKQKEFVAFFNPKLVKKAMPEYHYEIPEGLKARGGKAREILIDCEEADEYMLKYNSKNHEMKILKKGFVFESDTIVCENKVYMISYGEKEVSATEIFSPALAKTQRVLFDHAWGSL
ncbi:hypothetical protein HOE67_03150 [Candidatus Peregrinibacteria bacterium]|jgi:sugar-specific transcriptional regulator TrmB|nr:hypothetical protein [Candidatus Peregrinibacteria bacterium]MBT4056083.1 hypothetical protein [Candidatus Peregrinibacteria bacterium]